MKQIAALVGMLAIVLCLAGCAGGESQDSTNSNGGMAEAPSASAASNAVKIEEIDWSVGPGVVEGNQVIAFDYTNNSSYQLIGVEMEFKQRSDVTDEQRALLGEFIAKHDSWEEMNGGVEDLYAAARNDKMTNPGERQNPVAVTFNSTAWPVESMDQFDSMEPSMATIGYVSDGKIYVEYYDFASGSYSMSSQSGMQAVSWSDSELVSAIPRLESSVVVVTSDDEDYFYAMALGMSHDTFFAYVDACKEHGFTNGAESGSASYSATNDEGLELSVYYATVDNTVSVRLSAEEG